MRFHNYKVIICVLLQCVVYVSGLCSIDQQLDNVFLSRNFTAEELRSVFVDAKESYRILKDYQKAEDAPEEVLSRLNVFTSNVIEDLSRDEMTLPVFFANIKSYLIDDFNQTTSQTEDLALSAMVQSVMATLQQKLGQHYSSKHRNRYDVEGILSTNDTNPENFFRRLSVDPASVGYFFLESFATILGLSWGIISMLLSDSE